MIGALQIKATQRSDIILAVFVVAIAAMLLVPLPTLLLDFLLALNISFAFLLLLVGLYMPNALALLAFPSLLLLTTLFRLGLNVASARLILSQGDAGRVIDSFGNFLIRGEIVVGIIIFSIITIVNFIVIARGSTRVSEVAARFALDALPGKQMAIDSDLRAGLITPQEAQKRREDLRKESQLYGSMDGAMRFVQGDAIAGIFIIVTNIVGGLYLGVSRGDTFAAAVHKYSVLTVGDGLVSQIPALLISICAGIIVTRVSSGENATLGTDVGTQLFSRPGTLLFSGLILICIGILPGLPKVPFLSIGLLFCGGGYLLQRHAERASTNLPVKLDFTQGTGYLYNSAAEDEDAVEESTVQVTFDASVLYRLYRMNQQRYQVWWQEFRADFYNEVGIRLPEMKVVADEFASVSTYALAIGGSLIESGTLALDSVLVEVNPESAGVLGLEVLQEVEHPLSGSRIFWANQSPALRKVVDAAHIRTFDFVEYIGLKIAAFARHFPEEFITLTDVHTVLKQIEKKHAGLLSESFGKDFINVARFTELLHQLVREGISIKDYKQIVESVALYCSTVGKAHVDDGEFDLPHLVAFVRMTRKRQLLGRLLSGRRTLKVFTMSNQIEELLEGVEPPPKGAPLAIEPEAFDALSDGLRSMVTPLSRRGLLPVSILCRSELRHVVFSFLHGINSSVGVVTFDELDPQITVEQVGIWAM